jgi:hypothetical protein
LLILLKCLILHNQSQQELLILQKQLIAAGIANPAETMPAGIANPAETINRSRKLLILLKWLNLHNQSQQELLIPEMAEPAERITTGINNPLKWLKCTQSRNGKSCRS